MKQLYTIAIVCAGLAAAAPRVGAFDADDQRAFADGLYTRGLYDMAIREYVTVLREAPTYEGLDAVLFRLAECYRLTGNNSGAEHFYKRLLGERPDSAFSHKARFRRAELYMLDERYEDALRLFDEALERNPPDDLRWAAAYYKGKALAETDREQEAETWLKKAAEAERGDFRPLAALELGRLRENVGDASGALELYRRVLKDIDPGPIAVETLARSIPLLFQAAQFDACARRFEQLRTMAPEHARTREVAPRAAWALYELKRYADALARADQYEPAADDERPQWMYLRANALRQLQRLDEAAVLYDRLLERYPEHPVAKPAYYERILLSYRQGRYEDVVDAASGSALEKGELQEEFYWLVGRAAAQKNRRDEAVQYLQLLIRNYPDSPRVPEARYTLAQVLQDNEEWRSAERAYLDLIGERADDALAPSALMGAAYCAESDQRPADAVRHWLDLADRYPESEHVPAAWYRAGMTLLEQEPRSKALEPLSRLVEDQPDYKESASAWFWIGAIHTEAGAYEQAADALNASIEAANDPALKRRARYRLVGLHHRAERYRKAADELQELLPLEGGEPQAAAFLEWLCRYRMNENQPEETLAAGEALRDVTGGGPTAAFALYAIGWAHARQGREREAEAAWVKALEHEFPERAMTAFRLAELLRGRGDAAAAQAYYGKAVEWAQAAGQLAVQARAQLGLGRAAEAQDEWMNASRYYMSVAILFDDPEHTPEALYRAARAFEHREQSDEARRAVNELTERYPDSEWTQKARSEFGGKKGE